MLALMFAPMRQMMFEFRLPAVELYSVAIESYAKLKRDNAIADLLRNIKGTINDDEFDEVSLVFSILIRYIM